MEHFDVIVVGGGPAGMLAAITAADRGKRVALLERNDRLGKKLAITGKGRCNVTNDCLPEEILRNTPRNGKFLFSVMEALPPAKVMEFFESRGCALKTERGNRVFPVSDRSASIIQTLEQQLKKSRVKILHGRAQRLLTVNGAAAGVVADTGTFEAGAVILATGGKSYPATGSTGDGYQIAESLGHTIVAPEGSLVPMTSDDDCCPRMQGLSLRNVEVKLINEKGKTEYSDFGEMLFTHFGITGPVVLSSSAHMKKGKKYAFSIDLKPALDEKKLDARILRDLEQYQNRSMENALTDLLPRSMIPVVLDRLDIAPSLQANSLTKEKRHGLVTLLKDFRITISGLRPVEEAIITAGGVRTAQINPKTMESKLVPGLFFAGEIIDCDAYTGGFNLQIAWATGYAAGSYC